ncbi:MAG: hypothetical protein KBB01_01865 [Candidatus Omnitrophica bacterium]|jgi:uncharacterized membrane protein YheB (UPF0754 family)|nr:hypothetical protein [Candidatus Omnitrophota bacterium]
MSWKLFWQIVSLMIIGALLLLLINTVMIRITMNPFSHPNKYLWDKKVPRMEMPKDIPLER